MNYKRIFSESIHSFRFLNEPNDSEKDLFILMNEFEQESHKRASQNRARPNKKTK